MDYNIIKDSYQNYLETFEPYDWWVTLTFKEPPTERQTVEQYRKWVRKLNERIYGKRYRKKHVGLIHCWVLEKQKRGAYHVHSLMRGIPDDIGRVEYANIWEHQQWNNGNAFIQKYNAELGARGYLIKYLIKESDLKLEIPQKMVNLDSYHRPVSGNPINNLSLPLDPNFTEKYTPTLKVKRYRDVNGNIEMKQTEVSSFKVKNMKRINPETGINEEIFRTENYQFFVN